MDVRTQIRTAQGDHALVVAQRLVERIQRDHDEARGAGGGIRGHLLLRIHRDDRRHQLSADLTAAERRRVQVHIEHAREQRRLIALRVTDRADHRGRGHREAGLHTAARTMQLAAMEVRAGHRAGQAAVADVVADRVRGGVDRRGRPALARARGGRGLLIRIEERVEGHDLPAQLTTRIERRVDVRVAEPREDHGLLRLGVVPHADLGITRGQRDQHATVAARRGGGVAMDVRTRLAARQAAERDAVRHRVRVGVDDEPACPLAARTDRARLLPRIEDAVVDEDGRMSARRERERGEGEEDAGMESSMTHGNLSGTTDGRRSPVGRYGKKESDEHRFMDGRAGAHPDIAHRWETRRET